jgi:hypothetical protein
VSYAIQRQATGGVWVTLTANHTALTYSATGLTNGITYTFRVTSKSEAGEGGYTTASATPRTIPSAVRSLTAVPGASGQVRLSWLPPSSTGGAAVTDYVIQRLSNGTWATINDGVRTATSYTVGGLANGSRYWFRVLAKNVAGNSASSGAVSATPRTFPSAVWSLTAVPGSSGQVRLTWRAPTSNGGASITDYVVQRAPYSSTRWVTVNDGVRTATTFTVGGLSNGTRYKFRVSAKNAAGLGGSSNMASQTPRTVPSAPRDLRATPGYGRVTLAWSVPASNGGAAITRFVIQRSTTPTTGWVNLSTWTPATTRTFTATGLRNGVRHYFRVAAANAAGQGPGARS